MKKLRKIIRTLIVFLVITGTVYATTEVLPQNKFGIKKVAILVAGIFLVVQILFIAYQKDKIQENSFTKNQKEEDNFKRKSSNEIKEDENLFSSIITETRIETLPNKMNPKKRSLTLKKEIFVESDTNIKENNSTKNARKEVKIVRERRKRDKKEERESKKKSAKAEGKAKKMETKILGEEKKREIKIATEEKKKEIKKAGKTKKTVKKGNTKTKKETDKK